MDRLLRQYPNEQRLDVLINNETKLLLLMDSRHVEYEKQDLSFINKHSIKTDLKTLRPSDVVRLVRPLGVTLYSTDIESIKEITGGYEINIHPHCLIHYGTFKIKYREYVNEG
ncbi:hypothetical protein YUBABA_00260 [Serratia phage vB_SmaM-Yubaba]|nr:hypothetical protein SUREIYA_02120 [Serratia phage vB_SmaM-Sureiya]UQT03232.1 hypothetical protein YUBABA_00260 [Serratia phage vB_SmaM-Yubaba]